ncbi:MAG TPA: DHA2 family efflux MFS transporter permease subunit [Thermomicrobiales bacterium]|nr:DHA2 family efflux MFS transporter permease subunit [Thermomicrobiales bacterium]
MADANTNALNATSTAAPPAQRNPWLVLVVLCTGVFMLLIDSTIVNIAQRKIQIGLDANLSQIQWVLDAYILTFAVLLLTFGRLGDIFGRRRLFALGLTIFTLSSVLCGVSSWLGDLFGISGANALIFARVIQGIGGALMMPQSLSLLTVVFPPAKRGTAFGIWGSIVALGAVIGPVLGGYIVTDYAWEWVFLINVPVGIAAVIATFIFVPESVDPGASRSIDWGGVLLSGSGIFALVYALIEGPGKGWTSALIIGLFIVSAVLLLAFVWWEARHPDPIMKLELFRIRNFWVSNVLGAVISFGVLSMIFPLSAFLQGGLGFSPIRTGLTLVPLSVVMTLTAPFVGRLADRFGGRWFLVAGFGVMALGVVLLTGQINRDADWQSLVLPLAVTGFGMGLSFPPMTTVAMKDVPLRIAGSASGMVNTTRNIGQVLGVAVLGSVLQSRVGAETSSSLASTGIDGGLLKQIGNLAKANRFDEIVRLIPADQRDLLPAVMVALQTAFSDAVQTTLIVAAVATAVGAFIALVVENTERQPAPQTAPSADGEPMTTPVPAPVVGE